MSGREYLGLPRSEIPWRPSVDDSVCIGCGQCIDTCPNGVYKINTETGKVEVIDPENCVVLCDKCTAFCPVNAISFPDKLETKELLIKLFKGNMKIIK